VLRSGTGDRRIRNPADLSNAAHPSAPGLPFPCIQARPPIQSLSYPTTPSVCATQLEVSRWQRRYLFCRRLSTSSPWWPYTCSCQVTALNSFPPVSKNPIARRIPFIRHRRLIWIHFPTADGDTVVCIASVTPLPLCAGTLHGSLRGD
jgi:hypothetical protein